MTQQRNVQNCVTHHHPVLQATRLRRTCTIHLVKSGTPSESAMKKSRVHADKEISAIETLSNAKLEVDRALDRANKTLHRLLEEIPLESEAVTTAAELNSIREERVKK